MARLLSRLGRFCGRHRLAVPVAWTVVLVAVAAIALGGMKFSDGGFDVPGTQSSEAMTLLEEEFPSDEDASAGTLQLVIASDQALSPDDTAVLGTVLGELRALPHVASVSDPFDPTRPSVSEDSGTAIATITVSDADDVEAETLIEEVSTTATPLRDAGLRAEVGGSFGGEVPEIFGPTEIVGALLAFLVLLLTFGSLVAAGANMAGALIGVGVGILGVLAFSSLTPIGSVTPILAVMLGLAVGIDYCLFILARFRAELRDGRPVLDAIGTATGTAGSSVVFAGATVVIALVGLSVVGIPFLGEMGLAAAFAVAVAVAMALTLLPALTAMMGRRALSRRDRTVRTTAPLRQGRFLPAWIRLVTRRPLLAAGSGVLTLVVVSLPFLSMTTTLNIPGGEDPKSTQRQAYEMVAEAFGDGAQDPLIVLARTPRTDITGALPAVQNALAELPGAARVLPAGVSADGDTALLSVTSESGPLSDRTEDLVHEIRQLGAVGEADLVVTGSTAIGIDADEQLQSALVLYIALVVGLSFLLLVVLFRSLLVPLIATVGFLLSLGAGLGATTAVFQWGWLDALVQAPQGNPLLSLLPIVVTGILFGLAMDYQVFLVSRMHEAHLRGFDPIDAIKDGFGRSAVVVVAAAAIMTAVFGGFALSPSSLVGSIAFALTIGVLADAFIVRMIVVPAMLALLGRSAWWLPRPLERVLPRLDVEGAALEHDGHDAREPELAGAR